MKQLLAAAAVTLSFSPLYAQEAFGPLMTHAELADAQVAVDDLLVIDIRGDDDFLEGHVQASVNAPYALFRGPSENPGQLPSDERLSEVLGGIGAGPDRPTVVVYQGANESDFGAAARVYWTLKSSGVSQLAILNGGINAWTEAGNPLSQEPVPVEASQFDATFSDRWLATAEDVQAVLDGTEQALLLDARPESFWNGEQAHGAAARPGTLPQSDYFAHSGWFSSGPAIVDAASVRQLAEAEGFTRSDQLISFCNTGHWAATNWFALSELAGIENVKMYPESMVGWSNAGYDMANTPGMARNLWNQIKSVF